MAGKGDSMRPTDMKAFRKSYDRIFMTKIEPVHEEEEDAEDE